jgi:hypothetical protein
MSFSKRNVSSARLDRIKNSTQTAPVAAKPMDGRQRMAAKEAAEAQEEEADAHYMKLALIGGAAVALIAGAFTLPSLFETKATKVVIAPAEAAHPVTADMIKVTDRIVFYVGGADNPNQISAMAKSVRDTCLPKAEPHKPSQLIADKWNETGATATDTHPHAIRANFARGSAYLACALKTDQKRFCDSHYKQQIIQHIRTYADGFSRIVDKKKRDIAYLESMGQTKTGAAMIATIQAVQSVDGTSGGIASGGRWPEVPSFDADVAESLRAVSKDGYLSADDFISRWNGDSLPPEIAPYLVPAAAKRC